MNSADNYRHCETTTRTEKFSVVLLPKIFVIVSKTLNIVHNRLKYADSNILLLTDLANGFQDILRNYPKYAELLFV